MNDESEFPRSAAFRDRRGQEIVEKAPGLTRRELFAAMAMQGELSAQGGEAGPWAHKGKDVGLLASRCVAFADALIAELDKSDAD